MRLLLKEGIRFCIVGTIALIVHYVIYYEGIKVFSHSVAFTIGYLVSFMLNYSLTTSFTFKSKKSIKNGVGFTLCHVSNYVLQITFLNIFIFFGLSKQLAPIPVFTICVPINFLLVRLVMKKL